MKKTLCTLISPRALAVIAIAFSFSAFVGWKVLHDDGAVGATKKNGFGCTCHDFQPSDSVKVWIEGPSRIGAGTLAAFRLVMIGGPGVEGGLNVAAGRGALSPADTTTKTALSDDGPELTQSVPKAFSADTVRWEFLYQAPAADTTEDTLYSVGNSCNGNGNPTGDLYNFGEDFIVDLGADSTMDVASGPLPTSSALWQNYPNPFNPATTIRFEVAREGLVVLSVFDLGGRSVATLVEERKAPGSYDIAWDARELPSGIYFCRIAAPGLTATRKMLLLR